MSLCYFFSFVCTLLLISGHQNCGHFLLWFCMRFEYEHLNRYTEGYRSWYFQGWGRGWDWARTDHSALIRNTIKQFDTVHNYHISYSLFYSFLVEMSNFFSWKTKTNLFFFLLILIFFVYINSVKNMWNIRRCFHCRSYLT